MSAISRVNTYALHQTTLRNSSKTQSELFTLQKQISSGKVTDQFAGLPGQVERFTGLEQQIRKAQQYIDSGSVVMSRLKATQAALDKAIEIADDFQDLIVLRRNPANAESLAFAQQVDAMRNKMASTLNQTLNGRYLFGGTRTDTPPVGVPIQRPITPGVPDDGYYQGSKENIEARLDDSYEIEYNVRADDIAFQRIFTAFQAGLEGDASNTDAVLASAQQVVNDAIDELIAVQASVNADIINVQDVANGHEQFKLTLEGFAQEIINTDLLEASTQVAVNEAVLTASFQSFARISQLRLSDYLR